ncbi:ADP-ribosyl cyclase/cyclic ADP-ribose hydrolase 2 isoform X2 [Macrotis lagotis]|uniref:ADP-ribosyl cyclase/cyclic ADP-ribose hydrolase 2 isoform X2 n=1 Tax=Macrotis lagotis TaxID=92651 RepID=UPI003D68324F
MESSTRALQRLTLFLVLFLMGAGKQLWKGEGTNPYIESIFLGRCHEYISIVNSELSEKNCSAIWEAFKSVLHKDPCTVQPSDYDLFINLSRHSIPRDKSLFWEHNYLLVTAYADNTRRLMPVTDMLYGRVGDLFSWCPEKNGTDFDYQSCPTAEECENNAVDAFWKRVSSQYAHDSSGVIHVMLNGSESSGAYPIKGESCGKGSVKILENRLKSMQFKYECINDYRPVKLLKCVDYVAHSDCVFTSAAESTQQRLPSLFEGEWHSSFVLFLFSTLASGIQL